MRRASGGLARLHTELALLASGRRRWVHEGIAQFPARAPLVHGPESILRAPCSKECRRVLVPGLEACGGEDRLIATRESLRPPSQTSRVGWKEEMDS